MSWILYGVLGWAAGVLFLLSCLCLLTWCQKNLSISQRTVKKQLSERVDDGPEWEIVGTQCFMRGGFSLADLEDIVDHMRKRTEVKE